MTRQEIVEFIADSAFKLETSYGYPSEMFFKEVEEKIKQVRAVLGFKYKEPYGREKN